MEIEENRGLIHKKAYEDQWADLVSLVLELSLSLFLLSLSHTLGHLEFSWRTLGECGMLGVLKQEGKGRVGKHKRTSRLAATPCFSCRY